MQRRFCSQVWSPQPSFHITIHNLCAAVAFCCDTPLVPSTQIFRFYSKPFSNCLSQNAKRSWRYEIKINKVSLFVFNGTTLASFCLFSFFLKHKCFGKNCRRQRDSNSDGQSRRRACWPLDHHHGPCSVIVWLIMVISGVGPVTKNIFILVTYKTG